MAVAGGLAATEQVKYTLSPSFNEPARSGWPRDALTDGGSGETKDIYVLLI